MRKTIFNLQQFKKLSKNEQGSVKGGVAKDWDLCCLRPDTIGIPLGCESLVICDGDF